MGNAAVALVDWYFFLGWMIDPEACKAQEIQRKLNA